MNTQGNCIKCPKKAKLSITMIGLVQFILGRALLYHVLALRCFCFTSNQLNAERKICKCKCNVNVKPCTSVLLTSISFLNMEFLDAIPTNLLVILGIENKYITTSSQRRLVFRTTTCKGPVKHARIFCSIFLD